MLSDLHDFGEIQRQDRAVCPVMRNGLLLLFVSSLCRIWKVDALMFRYLHSHEALCRFATPVESAESVHGDTSADFLPKVDSECVNPLPSQDSQKTPLT
jgi:hypothetical protein